MQLLPSLPETSLSSSRLQYGLIEVESLKACDGIPHCSVGHEDESPSLCNGSRFPCQSSGRLSIPLDNVCDGTIDCDDKSDEASFTCPDRFFCSSLGGKKVS